ncbi:sulfatase-like hydrolase/transferase [Aureimonas sp. ME7]|uniref:sulfatase-like hydrolase/transferase n=1 Tax=Aureimonas sp. ME7 TaxID=2744252 RepID=UPI0015F4C371|nr:sulfatase-like hydrolase/transferase [Aureimonas sp. ME7]
MSDASDHVLFVTLDSCRYDTFAAGAAPNIKAVAPLHKAQSPSYFTYGSHSAMFVGFTPGISGAAQPLLDPKFGKLFKIVGAGHPGKGTEGYELVGRNIVDGFRRLGYTTIGTAAMGWFDPATVTGGHLSDSFEHFFYAGAYYLGNQMAWVNERLAEAEGNTFTFVNVGETHVPYWHEGAPWSADDNPCHPFQTVDRSSECRSRQTACLEFADRLLAPLIERHMDGTIIICGDHGDCWGEDGLWEHGIMHPMTTTVPLLIRFKGKPVERQPNQGTSPSAVKQPWLRRLLSSR